MSVLMGHRWRFGRVVVLLVGLLVLAGCSSEPDDDAINRELELGEYAPSTESTTTTEPVTTTTEPTTTTTTVEDAVRAAHTAFMTEYFNRDTSDFTLEELNDRARQYLTGPILERALNTNAERDQRQEISVGPGYDSNIEKITVTGDTALVLDCSQGRGERFSAEGELLIPADDFWKYRTVQLRLVDGEWLVEDFYVGGDERCEPAAQ